MPLSHHAFEVNPEEEEIKTPGVKQSDGFPKFNLSNTSVNKNSRSISTGLKPATAVRMKAMPWNNLQQPNYEVATTATSHSRRTAETMNI